jgi:hypothetical protein
VTTLKTVVPSDGFYTIKVSSPDYYSAYHLSIQ